MKRAAAIAAVLSLFLCGQAFAEDALRSFHKMQDALGGAEKLAAARDFEQTQSAESFDANGRSVDDVRRRARWIRPSFLRVDQVGPGSTYVL